VAVAEVVKGGGEGVRETVRVSAETWDMVAKRAKTIMIRQLPTYDYEKVVWNSTFTVGLVGVGWLAVKLGMMIRAIGVTAKDISQWVTNPSGQINKDWFFYLYDWCDSNGVNFGKDAPTFNALGSFFSFNWFTGGFGAGTMGYDAAKVAAVKYYRENPKKWDEYKAEFQKQYPDEKMPTGDVEHVFAPSDILDWANSFFDTYGSIVPIATVMGHMGLEFVRVKSLQRRIKKEAELE